MPLHTSEPDITLGQGPVLGQLRLPGGVHHGDLVPAPSFCLHHQRTLPTLHSLPTLSTLPDLTYRTKPNPNYPN